MNSAQAVEVQPVAVTLRLALLSDARMVAPWMLDESRQQFLPTRDTRSLATYEADWRKALSSDSRIYICEDRGVPIGTCTFDPLRHSAYRLSMTVAPEHRGMGYGTAIMRTRFTEAARLGATHLETRIHPRNTASLIISIKAGFTPVVFSADGMLVFEWAVR